MSRQNKTDAALRRIVLADKGSVRTKLQALHGIQNLSESFLQELVSREDVAPKLKTEAALRLAEMRTARREQAEIRKILGGEANRLAIKNHTESTETGPPTLRSVPPARQAKQDEQISRKSIKPIKNLQTYTTDIKPINKLRTYTTDIKSLNTPSPIPERETKFPATPQPSVAPDTELAARKVPENADKPKEQILKDGFALADSIKSQTRRCERAVENTQEFNQLSALKARWEVFELTASKAGIDLQEHFGESLQTLRPIKIITTPGNKRVLDVFEIVAVGRRETGRDEHTNEESCFGIPRGC
jgi:hypothetical protein